MKVSQAKDTEVDEQENKNSSEDIVLPRSTRWLLFIVMELISIATNMDNGIIPAATDKIMSDLSLNYADLGTFGSLDYGGRLIGSLVFMALISKINRRLLLIGSLIIKVISLFIVYITWNIGAIYFSRALCGFSQVFFTIYLPVWCDQYGVQKAKTMMITIIQVGNPVGVVLGFLLTSMMQSNWILGFIIEGLTICLIALILCFFPHNYFSSTLSAVEEVSEAEKEQLRPNADGETSHVTHFKDITPKKKLSKNKRRSTIRNLGIIMCNMTFLFAVLANAALFLVMTALQFWTADYMKTVLKITDDAQRTIAFSLVSITGPTCGVILGGVSGSYVGGYETKKAVVLCILLDILACLLVIPTPLMNGLLGFSTILWFYFFFSGSLIPLLTGIIISALPTRLRGASFSISNFILNLLGNFPASFVYGIIQKNYKDTNDRLAINVIMYYNFFALFLLLIAAFFRIARTSETKEELTDPLPPLPQEVERRRTSQLSAHIAQIFGSYGHAEQALKDDFPEVEEEVKNGLSETSSDKNN